MTERSRINIMPPDEPVAESVRGEELLDVIAADTDRVRHRKGEMNIDPYHIPDEIRPGGYITVNEGGIPRRHFAIDFNWKNKSVQGEAQHVTMQQDYEQGWRPVPHEWFPGRWAPKGTTGNIEYQDSYLVERPMSLTLEAKSEEKRKALHQVSVNTKSMNETPDGQAPRMVIANRDQRMDISIPD